MQEVLDPEDKLKRCDLLVALSEALMPLGEPRRVVDVVMPEAFKLAEATGDQAQLARISILTLEALERTFAGPVMYRSAEFDLWCKRANTHSRAGTVERVYADVYEGLRLLFTVRPKEGHVFLRRAIESARASRDNKAFAVAAGWAFRNLRALQDREALYDLVEEYWQRPREGVSAKVTADALQSLATSLLLELGDRARAEQSLAEMKALAERTRDVSLGYRTTWSMFVLDLLDGKLETAGSAARAMGIADSEQAAAPSGGSWAVIRILDLLGYKEECLTYREDSSRPMQSARAVLLAEMGRFDEAREILARFETPLDPDDESAGAVLSSLLEVATLVGDREMVAGLMQRLTPFLFAGWWLDSSSVGRRLGAGAAFLGESEKAIEYYQAGLEACLKIRFRPEAALIRLGLAELLLDQYPNEHDAAIEHLDFAIAEFREMKMQPALERALGRRGLLKA